MTGKTKNVVHPTYIIWNDNDIVFTFQTFLFCNFKVYPIKTSV